MAKTVLIYKRCDDFQRNFLSKLEPLTWAQWAWTIDYLYIVGRVQGKDRSSAYQLPRPSSHVISYRIVAGSLKNGGANAA